ncbi:P-loop containing nucleoside triphosphate hydrolase protein, partial [Lipomyces oligophaga]|uniref:P-loop containing nucleoside triphosphate hydrolase protein n=1 Tax=Lipomyces oligophaga TaxID=45792 RepID=UPI0034CFA97A
MEEVFEGVRRIMVIMGTGEGKSLLWTAPSFLNKPTLVVTPYRELCKDVVERCKAIKLSVFYWEANPTGSGSTKDYAEQASRARVITVCLDTALGREFRGEMMKLRLARIVFDEFHVVLTETGFREVVSKVGRLRDLARQEIWTTATLPVSMEKTACEYYGIHNDLVVRRSTINRPDIRYYVTTASARETKFEMAWRIANEVLRRAIPAHNKLMIFCKSKAEIEKFGAIYKMPIVHGGLEEEVISKQLERWLKEGGCIAATTKIGAGCDWSGIAGVVHYGMPYDIISFVQQSGRCSRDRRGGESWIVLDRGGYEWTRWKKDG